MFTTCEPLQSCLILCGLPKAGKYKTDNFNNLLKITTIAGKSTATKRAIINEQQIEYLTFGRVRNETH